MSLKVKRVIKVISILLLIFIIFIVSLAYLRYRDFKKALITKIAGEATSFIGQKVEIGDLTIGTAAGINIYDISVKNPEGFISGELLRIKKLRLKMKYSDLAGKKFYFQNITVYSPELTLIMDREGKMNISEKLKEFFRRKPTITYQIDELEIRSGSFDVKKIDKSIDRSGTEMYQKNPPLPPFTKGGEGGLLNRVFRNENINIHFKNLSSNQGTKTSLSGDTSFAGSRIRIDGWAYLKDEPRKFNISAISDEISFVAFKEIFEKYKLNTEKTKVTINFIAEGDIEKGGDLKMSFHFRDIGLPLIPKELKNIRCNMEAFFNINQNSVQIRDLSLYADEILSLKANALITNIKKSPVYSAALKVLKIDLSALRVRDDITVSGLLNSDNMQIKGTFKEMLPEISGTLSIKNAALKRDTQKNVFKDAMLNLRFQVKDKNAVFKADTNTGKVSTNISGIVRKIAQKDRIIEMKVIQPEVKVTDIRDDFWDVFPDSLLYAGLDGSISSDISIQYSDTVLKANGNLVVKNLVIQGENGEYSAGPINGVVPIAYYGTGNLSLTPLGRKEKGGFDDKKEIKLPSFERSEFNSLRKYYSQKTPDDKNYSKITIEAMSYGFKFLENVTVWITQEGNFLNIGHFSGKIFGGQLNGSAVVDISQGFSYRAGILLKGLSLTKLCEGVEPIKGYISGKVDGIASLKGSGAGISQLIGKADFWTYSTVDEKTKISKEFLQKIGGPSLKAYLGDRKFDKGIMNLYLHNGFVIFHDLEISNRNLFGMKDLSVKVAPFNNRIAIDHLMWSITEAAQRAKKN